jgi:hypothetical protein
MLQRALKTGSLEAMFDGRPAGLLRQISRRYSCLRSAQQEHAAFREWSIGVGQRMDHERIDVACRFENIGIANFSIRTQIC